MQCYPSNWHDLQLFGLTHACHSYAFIKKFTVRIFEFLWRVFTLFTRVSGLPTRVGEVLWRVKIV